MKPEIKLIFDEHKHGSFQLMIAGESMAQMVIAVKGEKLVVYHTEVEPEAEGKGLAKLLLEEMVGYARENRLKVVPRCAFVHAQFERHPEQYQDIWSKD